MAADVARTVAVVAAPTEAATQVATGGRGNDDGDIARDECRYYGKKWH
jgi:hypothetical protein